MVASPHTIEPAAPTGPVICAWCDATLRQGDPRLPASHGVCPDCSAVIVRDLPLLEALGAEAPAPPWRPEPRAAVTASGQLLTKER